MLVGFQSVASGAAAASQFTSDFCGTGIFRVAFFGDWMQVCLYVCELLVIFSRSLTVGSFSLGCAQVLCRTLTGPRLPSHIPSPGMADVGPVRSRDSAGVRVGVRLRRVRALERVRV